MMDPELKQKWIEALESGKYAKTTGTLRRIGNRNSIYDSVPPDSFCCLGVLCDIQGVVSRRFETITEFIFEKEIVSTGMAPPGFCNLSHTALGTLAELNDETDTFAEKVIPWIKENL